MERVLSDGDEGQRNVAATRGADESVERLYESEELPSWQKQLTLRAFIVSFFLALPFAVVMMKLKLTTGIVPPLNILAGLLGFFFIKSATSFLEKCGFAMQPFTRQENCIIQACVIASSGIACNGGFGSYLLGMSEVAKQTSKDDNPNDTKNPQLSWMIGFLFLVTFLGLFTALPLRKIMIIDYRLTYPSGTAIAHLINNFHTRGENLAKKQLKTLRKYFTFSFIWATFQWVSTSEYACGLHGFPIFGSKAYNKSFYFDFSATYVGVGMICPYLTNISFLIGAILWWGIMGPLIEKRKGDWYHGESLDSHNLNVYAITIATAMILGDGFYNFGKILSHVLLDLYHRIRNRNAAQALPVGGRSPTPLALSYDDQRRTLFFLKEQIPTWVGIVGYFTLRLVAATIIPHIFTPLKWYYIVVIFLFAPAVAFCNAYGSGLMAWPLSDFHGKFVIYAVSAWVGASHGGVLAGLAACGVMTNCVSASADLIQDFKTGYMTLASPRSILVSQIIGTAMGCVISPCVFWIFYKSSDGLGVYGSQYPAPLATLYRYVAVLAAEGNSSLPKFCVAFFFGFFSVAIVINGIRDAVGPRWGRFIPIPFAMGISFIAGANYAVDMCVGSLILFIWERVNKVEADAFAPTVASGLICGDGMWTLVSAMLNMGGVKPPLCMRFLPRNVSGKVDKFLREH
ncbi:probable metal-nicotianamine transporter YSL7 [Salvia hispanica]|uniref:probable metal-nicotianamine transporter YSL7 n=1 Tax=Salvia hispanica TaxID=49212 RepID=UPI002009A818|nr:probable metal-nicotianamine transporter YSL7 [Salvia hispanica]